jgi:hypothetical protein
LLGASGWAGCSPTRRCTTCAATVHRGGHKAARVK